MAESVGQISLDLLLNSRSFKQSLNNIQKQANSASAKISNSFRKIATTIGAVFGTAMIAKFGKDCTKLGSDLEEVQNVVDVTFATMSNRLDKWAKNAQSQFGLSETMAKKFSGTYGSMAEAFGFTEKQAYKMSTALTGLAGDVASFYNITQDEAYTKLKSVFSGETETLKDLGIVMTQTVLDSYALANGYGKTTKNMTEAEKVSLRFAFVQDQLKNATGDFTRTQDSWANQTRILQLRFESLKATLGQSFILVLKPLLKGFNSLLSIIQRTANKFNTFVKNLFGIKDDPTANTAKNLTDSANSADSLTSSTDNANKQLKSANKNAKKLKNSLAGFDKLNVLSKESSNADSTTSSPTASTGTISSKIKVDTKDLDKANKKAEKLKKTFGKITITFKKGFWKGFADTDFKPLKKNIKSIGTTLSGIFTDKNVQTAAKKCVSSLIFNLGRITGAAASIAVKWITAFVKGIDKSLKNNAEKIKKALADAFGTWTDIFDKMGDIAETLRDILTDSEVLKAFEDAVKYWFDALTAKAIMFLSVGTTIAYNIVSGIKLYITQNTEKIKEWLVNMLDISGKRNEILTNFYDAIADIFLVFRSPEAIKITSDIIGIFSSAFMGVTEVVNKFITDFTDMFVTPITDNAKKIKITLKGLFKPLEKVLNTIKKGLDDTFGHFQEVYDEKIHPAIMSIKEGLSHIVGVILDNWNKYIKPVIDKLANLFKSVWESKIQPALNGVSDAIGKVADKVKQVFNFLKPIAEWLIKVLSPVIGAIVSSIGTRVMNVLGGLFTIVSSLFKLAVNVGSVFYDLFTGNFDGIKEDLAGIWESIKGVFSGIFDVITAPFKGIGDFFSTLWGSIKDIFAPVGEWFAEKWQAIKNVFAPVAKFFKTAFSKAWKGIKTVFSSVGKWFSNRWTDIKNVFSGVGSWFKNIFKRAWNGIKEVWNGVNSFFSGIWQGIKDIFSGVGTWFSNIFKGAWKGIKKVFSGVGTWFKNLFNGILTFIKAPINFLISGLNKLIKGVNKISFDVPDWVPVIGGKKFGFEIPEIPKLAKGGLVKAPTLAVVGDNRGASTGNPEVVAPLNKLQSIIRSSDGDGTDLEILTQILAYLKKLYEMFVIFKNNGGNSYEFIAKINGSEIFKEIVKQNNLYKKRHNGKSAFA